MTSPATGVGNKMMRPWESTAANSDPIATPMAKSALIAVSTSMPPPMRVLMTTGTSDRATAPVIQKKLTAIAPIQIRRSVLSSDNIRSVEARTFGLILRLGAATPVAGMNRLAPQQAIATTINCKTTPPGARA
jgi:hypothetical protein